MHIARRLTLVAALLVCGCGSSTSVDAGQLLRDAKHSVDSATSLHFTLTSADVTGTGPLITGGQGDARRPNGFSGSFDVVAAGFHLTVRVVSAGGVFYAQTPLGLGYTRTDPSAYGFGDPAQLLDPNHGLSTLLTACSGAVVRSSDRLAGELLDEVGCTMPGSEVKRLLTSADPSQPVQATVGVDDSTHQLRRVVMVGPFFSKTQQSTMTLVVDMYGENVTITPPAG